MIIHNVSLTTASCDSFAYVSTTARGCNQQSSCCSSGCMSVVGLLNVGLKHVHVAWAYRAGVEPEADLGAVPLPTVALGTAFIK